MSNEMNAAIDKFATADLRVARREGHLLIGQTKRGTVTLTHEAGIYTITTCELSPVVLAKGKPAAVRPVLASLYAVEVVS